MLPFWMSVIVYPGAGQLLKKRYLSGLFIALAFTAAFIAFAYFGLIGCIAFFKEQVVGGGAAAPVPVSEYLSKALVPFLACVFLYIWSAIDAWSIGKSAKAEEAPDLTAMAEAEIARALNNPKPGSPIAEREEKPSDAAENH